MTTEINRMYSSQDSAHKAAAELREEGFTDVHVVSPPAGDTPLSAIAAQIAQNRVLLADARIYAKGVAAGGSLVTVFAPFGTGLAAEQILDSHHPIPTGMPEPAPETLWDEAAPLSSALMMPLLSDDATPISKIIGFSPLTSADWSASRVIGMPLLSENAAPLSSLIGMGLLSKNAAPLSSMIGMPTLKSFRPMRW
ncbi:MAG: hypothetical protein ACKOED_07695 [Aestuariivirga sp.]|uniref:hypothetical protein n=1 Tax=Aestuariivirga sp. TaxID=2650926 RepID=UPI0038D17F8B